MTSFIEELRKGAYSDRLDDEKMKRAADEIERLTAENERLRAALRAAHGLIDNDLVVPWVIAHKLDDVLLNQQQLDGSKE